ncbi:hypothetical protein [Nostoc sp. CMAA1605]|uniref:hypothetical protein n=1 Tax=Nostoc sp. CMAA1605 TaxID=2055159 RepID=UPI001F477322|nr:hypothetical protein [Nostoc sp. CMAA1605]MCF4966854.1 hypothetical protein [Nostoc sp. CMAA1605]
MQLSTIVSSLAILAINLTPYIANTEAKYNASLTASIAPQIKSLVNDEINNKASKKLPVIGVIKNRNLTGCGGSFQFVQDYNKKLNKFIFVSLLDGNTFMNFNGQDIKLNLISTNKDKKGNLRNEIYTANQIKIRVDYSLIEPPSEKTGYEASIYHAKVTISVGRNSKVLRLKGYHGC